MLTLNDVEWHHREGGKRFRAKLTCPKHNESSFTFYLKESCKEVKEIVFHPSYKLNGAWVTDFEDCIGEIEII